MKHKLSRRENLTAHLFILPLIVMMLVFLAYPIIRAAIMSMQYWYLSRPSPDGNYFLGAENYVNLFKDRNFYNSLRVTLQYLAVTVFARFFLGYIAALALNYKFPGRGLARALLIIPWAVPEVVACLVWILMYDKDYGVVNFLLNNVGILGHNIAYLQTPSVALPAAMVVNIWKGFPFVAVMLLAGMQGIDGEMYEASTVDGASAIQKLRYITVPSLQPVSLVVFLLLIIWSIKDYAIAFVLARGGPGRATEILTIFVQQTAFKNFDFGKAAAAGMVMLLVSIVFTSFYFRALNKEGNGI